MIAMRVITTLLFSLGLIGQAYAHHGSAPHFDSNDIVSFEGVVTQVYFVNPHAIVHFEVSDSNGSIAEWRCELSGASQLQRFGWSQETLSVGDEIRIVGSRARREANHCDTRSIHLADGTNLSRDIYIQGISGSRVLQRQLTSHLGRNILKIASQTLAVDGLFVKVARILCPYRQKRGS